VRERENERGNNEIKRKIRWQRKIKQREREGEKEG
jgi:hypothetical protein